MVERVETGVPGLNEVMSGGIPRGNLVLVSGGAGTGKSTICMQFLIAGAKKGERGIYVSTEQTQNELVKQAENYALPLQEMISSGRIRFIFVNVLEDESIVKIINTEIKEFKPERAVIDSISTFSEFSFSTDFARNIVLKKGGAVIPNVTEILPQNLSEKTMIKRMLGMLISNLRSMKATMLLTSELPEKGESLSSDGISEFLTDGVILLFYWEIGSVEERALKIRKMRYTHHEKSAILYEMSNQGIKIKKEEK